VFSLLAPISKTFPHVLAVPFTTRAVTDSLGVFLSARAVQGFLVGGCVRDALLGSINKDIDLAVEGDALALGRELANSFHGRFVALDQIRGMARVILPGLNKLIDLAPIKGSIEADLARRDFTIDAMALPLGETTTRYWRKSIIDPLGGRGDLTHKTIRMVSNDVFTQDPVRLLRAVRLSCSLDFDIEESTADHIVQNAHLVSRVSPERVRDEFLAILSLNRAKDSLHCLDDLGLLRHIIPELEITRGVQQPKEHYWDVFEHTIQTVGEVDRITSSSSRDALSKILFGDQGLENYFTKVVSDGHNRRTMLKLGALFHDIAKPQTKAIDETGRTRFLGHPVLGASLTKDRLRSLRFSTRAVKSVCTMVEQHLRPSQMTQGVGMPTPRAIHRFFRDLGDEATSVLFLSLADYLAARGPHSDKADWQCRVDQVCHVLNERTKTSSQGKRVRLITGDDLIETFGLVPGPVFRTLLEGVEEAESAQEIITRDEALTWVQIRLKDGG